MQTLRFANPSAAIDYATKNPKVSKSHRLIGRLLIPKKNRGLRRDIVKSHTVKSQFEHDNFVRQAPYIIGKTRSFKGGNFI